ncbi:MAG: hypothetical protein AB7I41_02240 [Candidatus Sericytochromatia bacterium]
MKTLVIYANTTPKLRSTQREHLYCFKKYSSAQTYYLNIHFHPPVPQIINEQNFGLIIIHTTFIATHWSSRETLLKYITQLEFIASLPAVKIALPQDEYINTDLVSECIQRLGIQIVYSVSPPSEWKKIYQGVDFESVQFKQVLTGYLNPQIVERINKLHPEKNNRQIDIGYRARNIPFSLGRQGQIKNAIGRVFASYQPELGLIKNISNKEEDTLLEFDWYKFLLNCKYVLGVEGGASVLDKDGSIMKNTEDYIKERKKEKIEIGYQEAESLFFPNRDGEINIVALSPRHLEACLTRTCQVLIEGNYNNILIANKHYIPLKSDFSNLNEVMNLIKQDHLRIEITNNAYKDIVESELYTYPQFVNLIYDEAKKIIRNTTKTKNTIFYDFQFKIMALKSKLWLHIRHKIKSFFH